MCQSFAIKTNQRPLCFPQTIQKNHRLKKHWILFMLLFIFEEIEICFCFSLFWEYSESGDVCTFRFSLIAFVKCQRKKNKKIIFKLHNANPGFSVKILRAHQKQIEWRLIDAQHKMWARFLVSRCDLFVGEKKWTRNYSKNVDGFWLKWRKYYTLFF